MVTPRQRPSLPNAFDRGLARQFRLLRFVTRSCLIAGLVLVVAYPMLPDRVASGSLRDVATWSGVALLGLVFALYFVYANRCPRCRRSFSDAPQYKDSDTDGLPLFNDVSACPFCGLDLRSDAEDG
jgi:hypothetical protein